MPFINNKQSKRELKNTSWTHIEELIEARMRDQPFLIDNWSFITAQSIILSKTYATMKPKEETKDQLTKINIFRSKQCDL